MEASIGDFTPGKQADFIVMQPRANSPLSNVLKSQPEPERILAALFTLGAAEDIREVHVGGDLVHETC
jgi:cytosine/adenosine deaminase-related metal-dependent hydrolase